MSRVRISATLSSFIIFSPKRGRRAETVETCLPVEHRAAQGDSWCVRPARGREGAVRRPVSLGDFPLEAGVGAFARADERRSGRPLSAGGSLGHFAAQPLSFPCTAEANECPLQSSVRCSRGKRHPVSSRNRLRSLSSRRRPPVSAAACPRPGRRPGVPPGDFGVDEWEGATGFRQCRLWETHPRAVLLWG